MNEKTTFEVYKTTNIRAGILQGQLQLINPDIKTREALLTFLMNYYHDNESKQLKK